MAFAQLSRQSSRVLRSGYQFRLLAAQAQSSQGINHNLGKHVHTSVVCEDIFNIQDEADFKKKVINGAKPVIVQFHAEWCGPCKQLAPRLDKIVGAMKGEPVDLAKVNIDDLPDLAMEYNVGAVPSVLGLKKGKVIDKFVGLQDEDKIQKFVSKLSE